MLKKFKVTRQIQFDKPYASGDVYQGNAAEVAHLVANGVLVPLDEGSKAAPKPRNKAAPKPQNRAEGDAGNA